MWVLLCCLVVEAAQNYDQSPSMGWSSMGAPSSRFGFSVALMDLNGDGDGDVVVGSPLDGTAGGSEGRLFGYVNIGSALPTTPSWTHTEPTGGTGAKFGLMLESGSFGSDSFDDVIAAAYGKNYVAVFNGGASGDPSATKLEYPATTSFFNPFANQFFMGKAVAAGDFDGDGHVDVAVSLPGLTKFHNPAFLSTFHGAIQLFAGDSGGLTTSKMAEIYPLPAGGDKDLYEWSYFGQSIASGRFTGGTADDLVICGPGYADGATGPEDTVRLKQGWCGLWAGGGPFTDTSYSWSYSPPELGEQFGFSVTSVDLNDDGHDDLAVGAPFGDKGRVYIFISNGTSLPLEPSQVLEGSLAGAEFGYHLAAGGDINKDGYLDLLVSAPASGYGTFAGELRAYHGSATGEVTFGWSFRGLDEGSQFGHSFSAGIDVNGDEYPDIAVGAFLAGSSDATIAPGGAYVLTPPPLCELEAAISAPSSVVASSSTTIMYQVNVENSGPSVAENGVVDVTLPFDVASVNPSIPCTASGKTVTCNLGTSPVGTYSFQVFVPIPVETTGEVDASVSFYSSTVDRLEGNNEQTVVTRVLTESGLTASFVAPTPATVYAGRTHTLHLLVVNAGLSPAYGALVAAALPAIATIESFTSSQGVCSVVNSSVTCSLGSVMPTATSSLNITISFLSTESAQAVVASAVATCASYNDTGNAVWNGALETSSDLVVTHAITPLIAGRRNALSVALQNIGPSSPPSYEVNLSFPFENITNVVITASTPGPTCNADLSLGQLRCTGSRFMVGNSVGVNLAFTPSPSLLDGQSFDFITDVLSPYADVDTANNNAATSHNVGVLSEFLVAFAPMSPKVAAGDVVSYLARVISNGPSDNDGIGLRCEMTSFDQIALRAGFLSSKGSCTFSNDTGTRFLDCPLGYIPAGGDATVQFSLKVPNDAAFLVSFDTVCSITGGRPTRPPAQASVTIEVTTEADALLVVQKFPSVGGMAGIGISFVYSVANAGPAVLLAPVLTIRLPEHVQASIVETGCIISSPSIVTCAFPDLLPLGTTSGSVLMSASQSVENANVSFAVTSASPDPVLANNQVDYEFNISSSSDLFAVLQLAPTEVKVSHALTVQATVGNSGPSPAIGSLLEAALVGMDITSATSSVGLPCTIGAIANSTLITVVSCSLGTIAIRDVVTVTILGSVRFDIIPDGSLDFTPNQTITASSLVSDPNAADNVAVSRALFREAYSDAKVALSGPSQVTSGTSFVVEVGLGNNGPDASNGIVLTLSADAPTRITSLINVPVGGWFNTSLDGSTATAYIGFIEKLSQLPAVSATLSVSPEHNGVITVVSSITTGTQDPEEANNMAQIDINMKRSADLSLGSFIGGRTNVLQGTLVDVTLPVSNLGLSAVGDASLSITLNAGGLITAVSAAPLACAFDVGTTWVCTGPIAADEDVPAVISIASDADYLGGVAISAAVSSGVFDPNLANNARSTGTLYTVFRYETDVAVLVRDVVDVFPAVAGGDVITAELLLYNLGDQANNVVLLASFPSMPAGSVIVLENNTESTSCVVNTTHVICDVGFLARRGSRELHIIMGSIAAGGTFFAEVTTTTYDVDLTNNNLTAIIELLNPQQVVIVEPSSSGFPWWLGLLLALLILCCCLILLAATGFFRKKEVDRKELDKRKAEHDAKLQSMKEGDVGMGADEGWMSVELDNLGGSNVDWNLDDLQQDQMDSFAPPVDGDMIDVDFDEPADAMPQDFEPPAAGEASPPASALAEPPEMNDFEPPTV